MSCENRIGILTFHKYYNYGTVLQAYALQNLISKNHDCEAELIDYTPKNEYVGKKLILTRIKRLHVYIKGFRKYYALRKNRSSQEIKKREFDRFFDNHMIVSERKAESVEALSLICDKYDSVMVGSDQTWNPFVSTKGEFLLGWLDSEKVTKLSYAPSIGISRIPDQYVERYKTALSDFSALSCRERGGAAFLSDLIGKDVEFVLDPTLLLTPEDWEKISAPVDIKEPYLLTYFLGDNKDHRKKVEQIARARNLKVVALPVSYLELKNKGIEKRYVGPDGFISLVKNASFVCTDSFHGTMFSINFNKNFLAFPKRNDTDVNSDNNRLYDILNVLGLEDRICIGNKINADRVRYELVNEKLAEFRAKSVHYLNNAIKRV